MNKVAAYQDERGGLHRSLNDMLDASRKYKIEHATRLVRALYTQTRKQQIESIELLQDTLDELMEIINYYK